MLSKSRNQIIQIHSLNVTCPPGCPACCFWSLVCWRLPCWTLETSRCFHWKFCVFPKRTELVKVFVYFPMVEPPFGGTYRETYICCFMRPSEIPQLFLLRSSKIPCSSTGSLANGCTYRGIIGIIPTFTGQKTYNPIPLKKTPMFRGCLILKGLDSVYIYIYVQPEFHHTTKLRNKTSYEAPSFHTSGTLRNFPYTILTHSHIYTYIYI